MSHIIDRVLLYLMGIFLIKLNPCRWSDMVYILTGLILAGATGYLGEVRKHSIEKWLYVFLPLAVILLPEFAPFVALTLYAGIYKYLEDKKYLLILTLFSVVPTIYSGIIVPDASVLIWALMLFMAFYTGRKSHVLKNQQEEMKHIRDDATERNAMGGTPGLALKRNSTLSLPEGPGSAAESSTRKHPLGNPSFFNSFSTEFSIFFVVAGSNVIYAPCSVCLIEFIISCSILGSRVTTLVVSVAGKYLLEIALLRLCLAYSVKTSVSLVTVAWSASVSKIVRRSRIEIPSLSRF